MTYSLSNTLGRMFSTLSSSQVNQYTLIIFRRPIQLTSKDLLNIYIKNIRETSKAFKLIIINRHTGFKQNP